MKEPKSESNNVLTLEDFKKTIKWVGSKEYLNQEMEKRRQYFKWLDDLCDKYNDENKLK